MDLDQSAISAALRYAEFDCDGRLVTASPEFLADGLAGCEDYLMVFASVDGELMTPELAAQKAAAWRSPGSTLVAGAPSGGEVILSSHPTAAGGLSLLAIERSGTGTNDPIAQGLLDAHPLPIWVHDTRNGDIVFLNAAARRLFEIDPSRHGRGNIADLFTDDEENRSILTDLKSRGRVENHIIRGQTMNGRELWLRGSASLIEHNGVSFMMAVLQNVASREERFSEVVRGRDLLNDALQAFSIGFALFDEDSRLIACNEQFHEINDGIKEFVAPGTHWESILRAMAQRRIARNSVGREAAWVRDVLFATERFEDFEIEWLDGSIIAVEVHPTSLGGFILSQTDITARRRAEQAARDSEQLLSKILQASPANLCMSRIGDGEIIYSSPASVALFGDEASARDQFADPLDRGDFLTELLPTGHVDDFPADSRNAEGEVFPALFSARVIDFRGEDVMVSTVTDLTERIAAERNLRDASNRLRDAIEALEEGFALFDADERLVVANRRYLEMNAPFADRIAAGTSSRELLEAAVETQHVVDAEGWLADYDSEKTRGKIGSHRGYEFQLTDGTWVNSVRRPTREGGFVITWLDVTEQRQAAADLRLVNDRLNDAIESLEHGFALYDRDDRLVTWNARYAEFNKEISDVIREGVPYPEILRRAIQVYDLDPDEIEPVLKSGTRDAGNSRFRFEFHSRDGRWFSVTRHPTSDDGFVITRLDITERKQMEEAQREEDEMMRRIMDASPAALVMSEFETGRILVRSGLVREVFGERETVSDHWAKPEGRERFGEILARDGAVDDFETVLRRKDGTEMPVLLSSRKIDFRGKPVLVTYTFDLTERLAMEEEIDQQRELLHQSEKLSALGELLAGVAHELNNPLSVVVGHSLMLEEEIEDPDLLNRTTKISAAAERCSRIVKTFLAMARQRPVKLEQISVNMVINTALDVAGYGLRSSGATIDCQLDTTLPPVMADADQLAQVLANLIVNAEHVLAGKGPEGRLTISTGRSRNGKEVIIEVADNGPGIPEPIRKRIFEPFFTTKTVGEGTGIGLAFCHRIIESHKGRITVGEADGGGARFTISLAATEQVRSTADDDSAPGTARGSVLVIDDEPDVADLIASVLQRDGYRVTTVASAEDGLTSLPGDFDVILSDLNMPGLSGRDFLTSVRERWPGLEDRIGFITGDTMSPGAEQFLVLAGRPYLEKPVSPADLRRLTAEILAQA